VVGETPFYERPAVRHVLDFLWFVHDPHQDYPLRRLLLQQNSGLGEATLNRLAELARQKASSLWELLCDASQGDAPVVRNPKAADFVARLQALLSRSRKLTVLELLKWVLSEFFDQSDAELGKQTQEWYDRLLLQSTQYGTRLEDFLQTTLLQKAPDEYDARAERVTLMTLHAAKGLEFPVVFLVGCEEGLLPYARDGEPEDLGEERRLFYVGLTRARQRLFLTHARRRLLFGRTVHSAPSRFLNDIEARLKELRAHQYQPPEKDRQLKLF